MNTAPPVISIAIITYQQLPFLKEAVASCLAQTFQDFEIVIADDGSTDGTREYVMKLAEQDTRIRPVLSETNTGVTSNSNRAFFACTGTYIAWLGGDDLMLPDKLQKQFDRMQAHPDCVLSYHDVEVFESSTGRVLRNFNSGRGSLTPIEGAAADLVLHGTINCGCATMVRRDACPAHGFDDKVPVASDWLHWVETARNGRVQYMPEILGRYRRHSANVTATTRDGDNEFLLTLGILEARYPDLLKSVRKRRAALLYAQANRQRRLGAYQLARSGAWESLRLRPFHLKTMGLLCLSILQKGQR